MFGYIRVLEGELKIKEYNHYKEAYCRLCRNIGAFSQAARLFLSYDMTFFSLLLDEFDYADNAGEIDKLPKCHKLSGHCKKACTDEVYHFLAAANIMLVYEKMLDDIKDKDKRVPFVKAIISKAYKRAVSTFPETGEGLHTAMEKYYLLEDNKADAFTLAEAFGNALSSIILTADFVTDNDIRQIYEKIFHCIGATVYLIDAIDDIGKDKKSGNYNPIVQFGENLESVRCKTMDYLHEAGQLVELLSYRKSDPIIRNIIYYGMPYQLNKAVNKEKL